MTTAARHNAHNTHNTRNTHHHDTDTGHANRLIVREWRPSGPAKGAFLLLHGMESHSLWWGGLASRLVGAGWAVVAFDRSGWGQSNGPRGQLASYREFLEETSGIAVSAREKWGAVHLAGMSWGGMAALYLALRRGWLCDSVTLLAPGIVSKIDIGFVGKLRVLADFFKKQPTRMVEPAFKPEHFTANPDWQKFIRDDPHRLSRVSASFCLETIKMRRFIQESAGRRHLPPALCLLAGADAIVDNEKTRDVCLRAGAEVEELPGAAHTLIFERPAEVAERMSRHATAASGASAGRNGQGGGVWIVGAGAVGGGVGALLSMGGARTGMLVKDKYLDALRRDGILLQCGHAVRQTGKKMHFASDLSGLPPDPDLVILAVKSFDTDAALASLAGRIPQRAVIASLQNGVGNEAKIAAAFPGHTIVAGSICASLEMTAPGEVSWPDDRGGVGGALLQGDAEVAKKVWLDSLSLTGMETRWYDGPRAASRLKWSKLMLNIGFNALNSITGMSSAQLLSHPDYGCLAVRALREGFAAMRGESLEPVDLPGFSVSKLRWVIHLPVNMARKLMAYSAARSTETAFSMRQDMLNRRQYTEIQELNGAVVASLARRGNKAPANQKLLELVEAFVKNAQSSNLNS